MKYRNPVIPEGINVSERHPLRELVVLAGGALALILVVGWLLGQFGGALARLVPYEAETALAPQGLLDSAAGPGLQAYLDRLAERVSAELDLPEGMRVRVHYAAEDTFNAFATLGGSVLLYRGLLEKLPHENALVMLLAHEIAHLAHRDPIVGVGQGVAIQLAAGLLLHDPNLGALGSAGVYTQMRFGRDMERDADAAALRVLYTIYGHIGGAADLFRIIMTERDDVGLGEPPAIFSTHPLDRARLAAVDAAAARNGWSKQGATTALPEDFAAWLRCASAASPAAP